MKPIQVNSKQIRCPASLTGLPLSVEHEKYQVASLPLHASLLMMSTRHDVGTLQVSGTSLIGRILL